MSQPSEFRWSPFQFILGFSEAERTSSAAIQIGARNKNFAIGLYGTDRGARIDGLDIAVLVLALTTRI
jgi:hypothetical protein